MKKLLLVLTIASLAGCATSDYEQYAKSSEVASVARSNALQKIAESNDPTAKVAAVMALTFINSNISAPQPNQALQWASILVPSITQMYGIKQNANVAINSSNNATAATVATTGAFVNIAGKIQAPVVTLPQANITTTTDSHNTTSSTVGDSMSGTGVLGSGTYSTQANPVTTTSTANPVTTTTTSTPIIVPDVIQIVPIANSNEAPIL